MYITMYGIGTIWTQCEQVSVYWAWKLSDVVVNAEEKNISEWCISEVVDGL